MLAREYYSNSAMQSHRLFRFHSQDPAFGAYSVSLEHRLINLFLQWRGHGGKQDIVSIKMEELLSSHSVRTLAKMVILCTGALGA